MRYVVRYMQKGKPGRFALHASSYLTAIAKAKLNCRNIKLDFVDMHQTETDPDAPTIRDILECEGVTELDDDALDTLIDAALDAKDEQAFYTLLERKRSAGGRKANGQAAL